MESGKQNNINQDLIIIGAGPAGCAAAIWGAQNGLKVTLLEASDSRQNKPGESFHPGIFSLLKMLNVDSKVENANFLRYSGQFVNWGKTSEFQEFGRDNNGPWLGIHATRNEFESILRNHAVSVGVIFKQPCKATALIYENERIIGVKTSEGLIIGKFIIDASGSRHWLSRQKKISINYISRPLVAYYGYVKSDKLQMEMGSFLDSDSSGWSWVARIDYDRFAWTFLSFEKSDRLKIVPKRLAHCNTLAPPKGANVTWRTVEETAGYGYFIVGDAACVFDPLSSDGVLRGIMTGIKASYLASLVINKDEDETSMIKYYDTWCKNIFDKEADKLKKLYDDLLNYQNDNTLSKYNFWNNYINLKPNQS